MIRTRDIISCISHVFCHISDTSSVSKPATCITHNATRLPKPFGWRFWWVKPVVANVTSSPELRWFKRHHLRQVIRFCASRSRAMKGFIQPRNHPTLHFPSTMEHFYHFSAHLFSSTARNYFFFLGFGILIDLISSSSRLLFSVKALIKRQTD